MDANVYSRLPAVATFVACGGQPDRTGHVNRSTLVRIIKDEFVLAIDIERLIDDVDTDGSGALECVGSTMDGSFCVSPIRTPECFHILSSRATSQFHGVYEYIRKTRRRRTLMCSTSELMCLRLIY